MSEKQHKRGIQLPIRMLIIIVSILLQVGIIVGMIYFLSVNMVAIYAIFELISVMVVIYIVNKPDNPSYKITWIIVILIFPLLGWFFYLIRGGSRVLPRVRKHMRAIEQNSRTVLRQEPEVESRLEYCDMLHARQSRFLRNESGYPVYGNTQVDYLYPGEKIWERLLLELENAEHSIYIEFFILAEGIMWDSVHKILTRKVAAGVDVRIIFDDFGSINRQYKGFIRGLRSEGIKVSVFNPIRPSVDMFMNNRNHRKIVVIDGKTAITGGFNIGDEYINEWNRFGYWMDSAIVMKGDAAYGFLVMFLNMWSFVTDTDCDYRLYPKPESVRCDGFVHPYCDGPFNPRNPAEGLYMEMINTAQRYVYITTPYLILDNEMKTALKIAAKAGIDVRIITPSHEDKWYVHPVTRANYAELLRAGVKIYEYSPGFIHSKLFVSDDTVATCGTVNMDYRSFYFHFECGAWLCGNDAVLQIRDHITSMLPICERITLEGLKKEPLRTKIKQAVLLLLAPFM